ncbi:hypothetical protein IWQ61_000462 [Dispira simplex]|nr:hypothetical protein IWQ61_000462 [Dispira simplex]
MNTNANEFQASAAEIASFQAAVEDANALATVTSAAAGVPGVVTDPNIEANQVNTLFATLSGESTDLDLGNSSAELSKIQVRQKIIDGQFALHPPPPSLTAPCWDKFCLVRDTTTGSLLPFAACKLCQKVYRYRGKENTTASMNQHRCKFQHNGDSEGLNLAVLAGAVPTLTYEMRQALLKSCVNFICRDDRPLNMVADNVFLELLQTAVTLGSKYGQFSIRDVMSPPSPDTSGSTLLFAQNGGNPN